MKRSVAFLLIIVALSNGLAYAEMESYDFFHRHGNVPLCRVELNTNLGYWDCDVLQNIVRVSNGAKPVYGLEGDVWFLEVVQTIAFPSYSLVLDNALTDLMARGILYGGLALWGRQCDMTVGGMVAIVLIQLAIIYFLLISVKKRTKAEAILMAEKERLSITLLSAAEGVIATDKEGKIEVINEAAQRITGWSESEAVGQPSHVVFNIINRYTRQQYQNPVTTVLETQITTELHRDTLLIAKDGTERPIGDSAAPIVDMQGNIQGVVLVFRDITEDRAQQARIEYLSYHDQLTGLYNRRYFEVELERLDTKENLPIAIIMTDVNGLKLTNDAFGHAMGDRLLQKTAKIILNTCRTNDIVARIGGDEFVMLLPRTGAREAQNVVRRIRKASANLHVGPVMISFSIGWGVKSDEGEPIQEIFKRAEDKMYRHKLVEGPRMREKTIKDILDILYSNYPDEQEHATRVGEICVSIGKEMGLTPRELQELKTLGLVHDIGKVALHPDVLNKAENLSQNEWSEVRRHPEVGYRILSSTNEMAEYADYVLAHHEHWDGSGYPRGLKGEDILLPARILAIADAYVAMTSSRPYRAAFSQEAAIQEIGNNAGKQFDPTIAKIFTEKVHSLSVK